MAWLSVGVKLVGNPDPSMALPISKRELNVLVAVAESGEIFD